MKRFLIVAAFALFAATQLIEGFFPPALNHFHLGNIGTNSIAPTAKTPASYSILQPIYGASEIRIRTKFRAADDNYDNVFQTADGVNAIRLEFTHPNKLNLALSDQRYFTIAENLTLGAWHTFVLNAKKGEYIEVLLDGVVVLRQIQPELVELNFDFGIIAVGTGYSRQRGFQGQVPEFQLDILYSEPARFLDLALTAAFFSLFVLSILELNPRFAAGGTAASVEAAGSRFRQSVFVLAGAGVLGWFAARLEPHLGKWFLLLVPLAAAVVLLSTTVGGMGSLFQTILGRLTSWFGTVALVVLSGMAVHSIAVGSPTPWSSWMLIGSGIALVFQELGKSMRLQNVANNFLSIAVTFVSWWALFELPNWNHVVHYAREPLATAISVSLICLYTAVWGIAVPNPSAVIGMERRSMGKSLLATCGAFASVACFLLLSFRYDSLFWGSSELHWEYFVGPIRAVREGAQLLWDAPSQYGFLNILLASLVPAHSAWQSLYLFQGVLLFISSCLAYWSLRLVAPGRALFAFLLVLSGVFFADPALIGPQLYPSSSVVRFFWCYVMVFLLARLQVGGEPWLKRYLAYGNVAWIAGSLWSAESAVYVTSIFFGSLIAMALFPMRDLFYFPRKWGSLVVALAGTFLWPAAIGSTALGLVAAGCLMKTGHMPDWRMFFEYVLSYGGGFGEIAPKPGGVIWLLMLAFLALIATARQLSVSAAATPAIMTLIGLGAGCWSISSYFVGRAVPSNVTAILPILSLFLLIGTKVAEKEMPVSAWLIKLVAIPLVTVMLLSGVASFSMPVALKGIATMTGAVEKQLRPFDTELASLKREAGITSKDAVVYYGFAASMPREELGDDPLTYEYNWLPTPLQLLEQPILPERRRLILERYVARHPRSGFFIQAKNEAPERASEWIVLISQSHIVEHVFENEKYRITRFRLRTSHELRDGLQSKVGK